MRVFLTGGTGLVGGGIARALLRRGHDVVGLARSETAVGHVRAVGVEPLQGDMGDADALRRGVAGADAVVHAALPRDVYERFDDAVALDERAVGLLVGPVAGTPTRLLYASGISVVGPDDAQVIDDDTPVRQSFWTERGAVSVEDAADDCREDIARDVPEPGQITVDDVRLVDDGGSEAVVLVTGSDGGRGWSTEMTLVQEDGEWRLHVTAPQ